VIYPYSMGPLLNSQPAISSHG